MSATGPPTWFSISAPSRARQLKMSRATDATLGVTILVTVLPRSVLTTSVFAAGTRTDCTSSRLDARGY